MFLEHPVFSHLQIKEKLCPLCLKMYPLDKHFIVDDEICNWLHEKLIL